MVEYDKNDVPNVKAIVGDSIGLYDIKSAESRNLVARFLEFAHESRMQGDGNPFTYTHIKGHGLTMVLKPQGENFVYDQIQKRPKKLPFPNMDTHFNDDVPTIRAIVGKTIGTYPVGNRVEAKQVQEYLHILNKSITTEDDGLFSYKKDRKLGLVMKLSPHGENAFLEMDVLDPSIHDLYKFGKFESFNDETGQARDLVAIVAGVGELVGGESRHTSFIEQTLYDSPLVPEFSVSSAELLGPMIDIHTDQNGKPTNDTYEIIMQPTHRGSFISDVPQRFSHR